MEKPKQHFRAYLKQESESILCDPENEYFAGHIDCFFPLAAREIVRDGLFPQVVARFLISAAHETLMRESKMSDKAASDEIIKIAMDIATLIGEPVN